MPSSPSDVAGRTGGPAHAFADAGRLAGAKVAVIGLGASGEAATRLALALGGSVYASDSDPEPPASVRLRELVGAGAGIDVGGHDVVRVAHADVIVVSPGIPPSAPILRELARRGRRWISEPEFAIRFHDGALIAVTGTNGKTTTSLLAASLLESSGANVVAGGNVGGGLAPAASELALRSEPADWWVLELSSFQLAGVERLRPDVAVVTNLAPDHLDRYPNRMAYYADKAKLARGADAKTRWVLPQDDPEVTRTFAAAPGERHYFEAFASASGSLAADPASCAPLHAFLVDGTLHLRLEGRSYALVAREDLPLLGRHNVANALAASLAAALAGAGVEGLRRGLKSARPLPHRLEPVGECDGVLWVNDSKATNLAAARSAIASMNRPIVLIAGGKDKGEDFSALVRSDDGVLAVVATGEAGPRLTRELAHPSVWLETELAGAVARARELAREGDCVLFSPACSSFDQFADYGARGDSFRSLSGGGG